MLDNLELIPQCLNFNGCHEKNVEGKKRLCSLNYCPGNLNDNHHKIRTLNLIGSTATAEPRPGK